MGVWDFLKGSRSRQNTGNSLMESFRSENWSKMNADQRLAALQKLENITAGQEGRTARTVVPEKMENDSTYGYFNETSSPNSLHINEKLLNGNGANGGYDAIDTLWHEGRHAYQYDAYSGRLLSTANPPDKDTQELWKANFDNDIYRNSGTAYYYQPIETDANRFARGKLKENENYFAGDPAYEKYQVEAEQTYCAESIDNMCGSDYEKQIADEIRQEYQERQEKGVAGGIEKADAEKTAPEGKLKHSWMDEPLSEAETAQLLENDPGYADGILPEKAEDYNETGRYRSAETDISEDERERLENEQLLENDPGDVNEKVLKEDDYYYATGMHRPDWGDDSMGEKKETTIPKGTVLDQYSHPDSSGKYFAPEGTAYEKLELNDVPEKRELHRYEVMKDIPMTESKVGQQNWNKGQEYDPENAATQYQSDMNADELVEKGYLKEIPVEKEQIEKPKDGEGVESKAGSETAKPEPKENKETKGESEPKENKEAKAEDEPKENKEAKAES
ncbi:MAG: glycohydrolase toxin TNT-related protein, partial [Eubacteriales bacterium]|nr:glycohydrolase toxin TNT-related protein [Eubacteriales bacterium]